MGIGVSIFLIAVGAVLAFAVNAEVSGLDIQVVGWILLGVGAIGILLSLLFWSSWGGWGRREVVEERPGTRRETVVREEP
jgi:Domain of unknown function (DUF6458)